MNLIEETSDFTEVGGEDDDREIAHSDAKLEREQRVVAYIRETFAKLGLTISADDPYPISYEEGNGREVVVLLEDEPEGYSIKMLNVLNSSDLSSSFRVAPNSSTNIEIRFFLDVAAVRSRLMS